MENEDRLPALSPDGPQLKFKLTQQNLDAIVARGVNLRDLAEFHVLAHSKDPYTQNMGLLRFNALWKIFNDSKQNQPISFEFGAHGRYAILLLEDGFIEYHVDVEFSNVAPFKWHELVNEALVAAHEIEQTVRGRRKMIVAAQLYSILAVLHNMLDGISAAPDSKVSYDRLQEALIGMEVKLKACVDEITTIVLQFDYQAAQRNYLLGMLPGLAIVGAVVVGITLASPIKSSQYPLGIVLAGGALGALLSVLSRTTKAQLSKSLIVDVKASAGLIFSAGAFRPVVGALFGIALYALIASGLVPIKVPAATSQLYFFVGAISFLAGFSERLAQDALIRTSRGIFGASNFKSDQNDDVL